MQNLSITRERIVQRHVIEQIHTAHINTIRRLRDIYLTIEILIEGRSGW